MDKESGKEGCMNIRKVSFGGGGGRYPRSTVQRS